MRAKPYPSASAPKTPRRNKRKEKTAEQLISELAEIRQRIASLEAVHRDRKGIERPQTEGREQPVTPDSSIPISSYTWQRVGDDFVLVDFNDTAVETSGEEIIGLVGKTAGELNGHIPILLHDLAQCFAERSSIKRELYCRINNIGSNSHLAINTSFVLPDLVLTQTEDITLRKETEEAIHRAKREWERALDSVPDLIAIVDNQHRIVRINRTMAERLGVETGECVGETCYSVVHGLDTPPDYCPHVQVLKDGQRHTVEFFEERLGGDFVVNTSPLLGPDGQMIGSMHIAHEHKGSKLTDEKILQLIKELAVVSSVAEMTNQTIDLDEILNLALEQVADVIGVKVAGVYLVDKEMQNLDVKVVKGVSETTSKVISPIKIGKGVSGCVIQSGEPIFIESLPDSVELIGRKALRMVIQEQLKAAVCIPLKARGRTIGVMYAMTDHERVLTQDEREFLMTISHQISNVIESDEMYKAMEETRASDELDRLRMAFLASISHEIRTPLASIKGFASTLLQPDVQWDAGTQKDFIGHIDMESDRLMRIVNDILDMSRISCGAMKLDKSVSMFDEVLTEVSNKLRILTQNHKLEMSKPTISPLVLMDEVRIGQVITNLIENAACYSPEGTLITLKVEVSEDTLMVSVVDRGHGIPVEYQEKIFDQFFRLEESIKRRRDGSGLGLAICKGIIQGHGGDIHVESEHGRGSRFSFSLPLVKDTDL